MTRSERDAEVVQWVVARLPWTLGDPDMARQASKSKIVVEYARRNLAKPIGVAEWETKLVEQLPEDLRGSLPTVEEIEAELSEEGPGGST